MYIYFPAPKDPKQMKNWFAPAQKSKGKIAKKPSPRTKRKIDLEISQTILSTLTHTNTTKNMPAYFNETMTQMYKYYINHDIQGDEVAFTYYKPHNNINSYTKAMFQFNLKTWRKRVKQGIITTFIFVPFFFIDYR